MRTQWRVSFSGLIGIDYGAMYLVANTLGIDITPDVLERIQALEDAYIEDRAQKSSP